MFKRAEPLLRRIAPSTAERAVPVLTEVLAPGDPLVESLYRAGGIDPAALGASAFAYGPEALAILEREAAADGPTSHGC